MKTFIKTTVRVPIAALGCSLLLMGAGCSRSSDGSVIVNAPPSLAFAVPPYLRPDAAGTGVRSAALSSFPPPPATPAVRGQSRNTVPRVKAWKVAGVKPPFERADPEAPITCRNETRGGGRVKVVCE